MRLRSLRLVDFRSYHSYELALGPALNVLVGPNGTGKSNLLEAVYLLMIGRSFRGAALRDLIRLGGAHYFVEGVVARDGVDSSLRYGFDGERRRIFVGEQLCSSTAQLLGQLQGVLLSPQDEEIVSGAPAARRAFLDMQLAQSDPLYVYHLTRYGGAQRQRNALLRARDVTAIKPWEAEMARSGAYIRLMRERLVVHLQRSAAALLRALYHGSMDLRLSYRGSLDASSLEGLEEGYLAAMESQRRRELDRGYSLVGPHRDDLELYLGEGPARLVASEGEKRLIVSALKLAEWHALCDRSGETPLMLADDMGLGLDQEHKARLLGHYMGMGQVIVTTPDLPVELPADAVVHTLEKRKEERVAPLL